MMRFIGWPLALVVLLSNSAVGQEQSPSNAYLAFVTAAQKATSLDQLLPYLSKEYRSMLTAQPTDKKGVWLKRLKDSGDKTDIKISKETITGSKCTLEATAKDHSGTPLKGKIGLVKEDGAWKLDEQGWST